MENLTLVLVFALALSLFFNFVKFSTPESLGEYIRGFNEGYKSAKDEVFKK